MMPTPTLTDEQLDELLERVRKNRRLPTEVVWAGEHNDGEVLHVGIDLNGRVHHELCIRQKPERAHGRKWELVRPLFLIQQPIAAD
jgi:hypothetical protein